MEMRPRATGHFFVAAAALAVLGSIQSGSDVRAQQVRLVGSGESWVYLRGTAEPPGPPGAWTGQIYDDSAWAQGVPPFGAGSDDTVTSLPDMVGRYSCLYVRKSFSLGNPMEVPPAAPASSATRNPAGAVVRKAGLRTAFRPTPARSFESGSFIPLLQPDRPADRQSQSLPVITRLFLTVDYQDGFVAYLNGVEIARRGLGSAGTFVPHDAVASPHASEQEETVEITPFLNILTPGGNVLALQGCNTSLDSPGFTLDARLIATGPVALTRYPYLQRPSPDTVVVVWRTERPSLGGVLWRASHSPFSVLPGRITAETDAGVFHAVALYGLSADTEYTYTVLDNGRPVTTRERFRTLPARGSPRIEFNAVGDSGVTFRSGRVVRSRWIATGAYLGLRLGDMATPDGIESDFETKYFGLYADFLKRAFDLPCIGNHDIKADRGRTYLNNFILPGDYWSGTGRYYAFEAGPALFVSLDDFTSPTGTGSRQLAWLEKTLASSRQPWKFVIIHNGPFSSGSRHGGDPGVQRSMTPVFERYGVDIVFSGHDHDYERSRPLRESGPKGRAVRYVVTGGGGQRLHPLKKPSAWTAFIASVHEFVHVSVDGPCLCLTAIRPDGAILDRDWYCKYPWPPEKR